MQKKLPIVACLLPALSLFSGCTQESSRLTIFNSDKECYFSADCWIYNPALEDYRFCLPLVTDSECKTISDLKFYYQGTELDISVSNLSLPGYIVSSNANNHGWRYSITADLNKNDITDKLIIDQIQVNLNEKSYSFPVNICISYKYIQPEYHPLNFLPWRSNLSENSIDVTYLINCPITMNNWTINKVSHKWIEDSLFSYSLKNENEEEIDISDTLKCQPSYFLTVHFDSNINYYVSDSILLDVLFNDNSQHIQYCSNVRGMTDSLAYAMLQSEEIQFFE